MTLSAIFDSYWYWLSAALLLLLLEVLIPGAFLMWIGFGAAGVGLFLLVFPTATLVWQLVALAICVSGAVLIGVAWQKKSRRQHPHGLNQGLDSYLERIAVVSQDFAQGQGRIRLDDSFFTAYSSELLVTGQNVIVTAVDKQGLHVKPHP